MDLFDDLFGIDLNGDGKTDLVDALIFDDATRAEENAAAAEEEEFEAYLTTVDDEENDY